MNFSFGKSFQPGMIDPARSFPTPNPCPCLWSLGYRTKLRHPPLTKTPVFLASNLTLASRVRLIVRSWVVWEFRRVDLTDIARVIVRGDTHVKRARGVFATEAVGFYHGAIDVVEADCMDGGLGGVTSEVVEGS